MKYRYILDFLSCWRKSNGYTDWAFRLTSTVTGAQLTGRIAHSSNLNIILANALGTTESVYQTDHDLTLKQFRAATAGWTDCDEKTIRDFLKA